MAVIRMQRTLSILLAIGVTLPLGAQAPANDTNLLKTRESVWRAWVADDAKLLRLLVPVDTIVFSAGDKKWKNQADVFREADEFRHSGAKLVRLEFPRTRIQHFGEVAMIWSDYVIETQSGGKPSLSSGRATEIFVWREGRWVNPGWHTDEAK
jgi:hypothetical protein